MEAKKRLNSADHLANERTFLAWIRTNLGIMAFGFVVEKFSFFIEKLSLIFPNTKLINANNHLHGFSNLFGVCLVGIGAVLCVIAFVKFKKTEKEINDGIFLSTNALNTFLAIFVFLIGVALMVYLIMSRSALIEKI